MTRPEPGTHSEGLFGPPVNLHVGTKSIDSCKSGAPLPTARWHCFLCQILWPARIFLKHVSLYRTFVLTFQQQKSSESPGQTNQPGRDTSFSITWHLTEIRNLDPLLFHHSRGVNYCPCSKQTRTRLDPETHIETARKL